MVTANTPSCIEQFIGKTLLMVVLDTFPLGRADLARGTKTLVFDDWQAVTFSSKGSYWSESVEDVQRWLNRLDYEHLNSESPTKH